MTINADELNAVIEKILGPATTVLAEDDVVVFGMIYKYHKAQVCLHIFDKQVLKDGQKLQAIGASFSYTNEDGDLLDFRSHPFDTLLKVCNELQHGVDWGTISPTMVRDGSIEVSLYRACNTSRTDLDLALAFDPESELVTTIYELGREFELTAPVVQGFHEGSITGARNIRTMIGSQSNTAAM